MNKNIRFMLLLPFALTACSQAVETLETIREKCHMAMFGTAENDVVKTMTFVIRYPGHDYLVETILQRPNRFANLTPGTSVVVDGDTAFIRKKTDTTETTKTELIPAAEMADFVAEPTFYYPAFFDHDSHFRGEIEYEGKTFYLIEVLLTHHVWVEYFINMETFLPDTILAHVKNRGKDQVWGRQIVSYQEVEGWSVPLKFKYFFGNREKLYLAEVQRFVSNTQIEEGVFAKPQDAQEDP